MQKTTEKKPIAHQVGKPGKKYLVIYKWYHFIPGIANITLENRDEIETLEMQPVFKDRNKNQFDFRVFKNIAEPPHFNWKEIKTGRFVGITKSEMENEFQGFPWIHNPSDLKYPYCVDSIIFQLSKMREGRRPILTIEI